MTEHHGRADEHDDRARHATSGDDEGSYVDAQVPDDTTTTEGPHDGEPDGSYTDSDVPSDR